ncbi:hypothetical protein HDV05_008552, partial [Chytridiales sp. JEL 0842]
DEEEESEDEDGDAAMDGEGGPASENEEEEEEEYEEIEVESKKDDFDTGFNAADDERQYKEYLAQKQQVSAVEEDLEFPDEVETPRDTPARVRFARYRGLKSFRTSPWDPYENLPADYARIFQFENFKKTKTKILREVEDSEEGMDAGRRVVVWIDNVPARVLEHTKDPSKPYILFSLLPHEHKITLSTLQIHRPANTSEETPLVVKSKDPMILFQGFRKLVIRPIYSSDTRGGVNNVHKFSRYLHAGTHAIASFYGPIGLTSEPCLLFKPSATSSTPSLIATGALLPPSPTRIVAKKIILTGHPFKIHKRSAVIRFMFHNPADVEYFKPVQLYTKHGRIGHIRESLGTHGYMKCLFDEQIKGDDTVCMGLYKRVFPRWGCEVWDGESGVEKDGDVEMEM